MESKFKYNEKLILEEIFTYIASTYGQHYVGADNVQLMDLIMADKYEEASGFLRYNAIKYLTRHGKKAGTARADLLKSVHYTILLLSLFDKESKKNTVYTGSIIDSGPVVPHSEPKLTVSKDWASQYGISVAADPNVIIRG